MQPALCAWFGFRVEVVAGFDGRWGVPAGSWVIEGPGMATNDQVQAKIEAFARQLAEGFGEIDEENAMSWIDSGTRGDIACQPCDPTKLQPEHYKGQAAPPVEEIKEKEF